MSARSLLKTLPASAAPFLTRLASNRPSMLHRSLFTSYKANTDNKEPNQQPNESETPEDHAAPKIETTKPEPTETPTTPQVDNSKIAELQNSYLQCLADMENLRSRTAKEVEQSKQFAIQKFAKDLLDTVDVISMALNSIPKEILAQPTTCSHSPKDSAETTKVEDLHHHLNSLFTGVTLMETELLKALRRHGVERFEPIDQQFDPNLHQAMFQAIIPGKESGTVFSVQKSGFTLNGRVIRPAQVGVVKDEN